jgi:hypothetical protein
MKQKINISNFVKNNTKATLEGKIEIPKFNLAGAKLLITEKPKVEGCVVELFSILNPEHGSIRVPEIEFKIGEWYLSIKIFSDWEEFNKLKIKSFYLVEPEYTEIDYSKLEIPKNAVLLKFKNMSLKEFSTYYIDLRGGETGGVGRNEHGPPHFHILRKSDKKDLGKVFFPTFEEFENGKTQLIFSKEINSKMKKEISKWVFELNQKNLITLNSFWKSQNSHNNRVHK